MTRADLLALDIRVDERPAVAALDRFSSRAESSANRVGKAADRAGKAADRAGQDMSRLLSSITGGLIGGGIVQGLEAIVRLLPAFVTRMDDVSDVSRAFANIHGRQHVDILREMSIAAEGDARAMDLMRFSNRLTLDGLQQTAAEMGRAVGVTKDLAEALGLDLVQALDAVALALTTGTSRELRMFGIGAREAELAGRDFAGVIGLLEQRQTQLGRSKPSLTDTFKETVVQIVNATDSLLTWINTLDKLPPIPSRHGVFAIGGVQPGTGGALPAPPAAPPNFGTSEQENLGFSAIPIPTPYQIAAEQFRTWAALIRTEGPDLAAQNAAIFEGYQRALGFLQTERERNAIGWERDRAAGEAWIEQQLRIIDSYDQQALALERLSVAQLAANEILAQNQAVMEVQRDAVHSVAFAFTDLAASQLLAAASGEQSVAKSLKAVLKALGQEAMGRAAFELAAGFASLAIRDTKGAALHFKSAGLFGAIGFGAGLAGGGGGGGAPAGATTPQIGAGGTTQNVTVVFEGQGVIQDIDEFARELGVVLTRQMSRAGA